MNTILYLLLAIAVPPLADAWACAPLIAGGVYHFPPRQANHIGDANEKLRSPAPAAIKWVSLDVARHSGKPIWLHVSGEFCAPCRALESGPFRDPRLIAASQRWACVHMDAKDTMMFRTGAVPVHQAMGITTVPRDVFVRGSRFQMAAPSQPCPMDAAGYVKHLDQWWSKAQ
jgi:hypothetical protein